MKQVFKKPDSLKDARFHYCPGCSHGVIHRLIAEVVDELGIRERTIGIAPVGCAVLAYDYFDFDMLEVAHGRPPAAATGLKRARPDSFVFSYQGDGDLASIGMAEIIHAANRGENFSVIFVNNAVYGMTGGQMAPTTLVGQKTQTTPQGRDYKNDGYPIRVCELLATLEAPVYLARVAACSPKYIKEARRAIRRAFSIQLDPGGFSLVEVLATCPVNWGVSPLEASRWVEEALIPYFPLGVFRDIEEQA
jgi:2-oxoglutarate ferredoxin oxidoreductase subunit beta